MAITSQRIDLPSAFCWTKMGGESGEVLERIIQRKNIERHANDGTFIWGIGSSVGSAISNLSENEKQVPIVFSRMLSNTKSIDAQPKTLLLWLGYYDSNGTVKELPRYSLVTSRGETEKSLKKSHYALFCHADFELSLEPKAELNAKMLVNYSSGRPLGFSQVTAVVRKESSLAEQDKPRNYSISTIAELKMPYFAKLACPVPVSASIIEEANKIATRGNTSDWKRYIDKIKESAFERETQPQDTTPYMQAAFAY